MVPLILFGILGLGFTIGFFWKRSSFLAYGAAGMWAITGFQSLTMSASANPTQITDTYMAFFWLCVAFVIGCALLPLVMREKAVKGEDVYVDRDIDGSDLSGVLPQKSDEKKPGETKERPSKFSRKGILGK